MKKICDKQDMDKLDLYPKGIITTIMEIIEVLDDNYGVNRNIDEDLGGCILILETKVDVIEVKENIVKDIIPEYVDDIECEGGKQYCLSLFLLSSDYAVVVVAIKELMDILVEE